MEKEGIKIFVPVYSLPCVKANTHPILISELVFRTARQRYLLSATNESSTNHYSQCYVELFPAQPVIGNSSFRLQPYMSCHVTCISSNARPGPPCSYILLAPRPLREESRGGEQRNAALRAQRKKRRAELLF